MLRCSQTWRGVEVPVLPLGTSGDYVRDTDIADGRSRKKTKAQDRAR